MKKQGFTLIEVIIVIVILAVLAMIALPRITAQIEVANAAEAMQMFGVIKRAFFDCTELHEYDATNCTSAANLGIQIPAGSKFTYTTEPVGGMSYTMISAHRMVNGVDNAICLCLVNGVALQSVKFAFSPAGSIYSGVVQRTGAAAAGNICALFMSCGDPGVPF